MKIVALAGGTGSAKLLRGLARVQPGLSAVCNVGDNFCYQGLYVCPDVDIAMYSLAGVADRERGWGMSGDTFAGFSQLRSLGEEVWFQLGDRDSATSLLRTRLMKEGMSLTEATEFIRKRFHVREELLPASDDRIETRISTPEGSMHLQEFWVRERGRPAVKGVSYRGIRSARPSKRVISAIEEADRIVLCPANPVTSIGPTLAIPGIVRALMATPARIVALCPMIGEGPISGPAAKLMRSVGIPTSAVGVAAAYRRFLDSIIIDRRDSLLRQRIQGLGMECITSDILMRDSNDEDRLARELIEL